MARTTREQNFAKRQVREARQRRTDPIFLNIAYSISAIMGVVLLAFGAYALYDGFVKSILIAFVLGIAFLFVGPALTWVTLRELRENILRK